MVFMCIVVFYFVFVGFSVSFIIVGGFGNNYYLLFEGIELEQVRQLDQQYTVFRVFLIYGGVIVFLGLGVFIMGVLFRGVKNLIKLLGKWFFLEVVFSFLVVVGYCIGIGIYFYVVLRINFIDICKIRERFYVRKGFIWMNCQLVGIDGVVVIFVCFLVIMYGVSVVLVLRSYREQKRYKDNREQYRNYSDVLEYLWFGIF